MSRLPGLAETPCPREAGLKPRALNHEAVRYNQYSMFCTPLQEALRAARANRAAVMRSGEYRERRPRVSFPIRRWSSRRCGMPAEFMISDFAAGFR